MSLDLTRPYYPGVNTATQQTVFVQDNLVYDAFGNLQNQTAKNITPVPSGYKLPPLPTCEDQVPVIRGMRIGSGSLSVGAPPFPVNDTALLVDIGTPDVSPVNKWTSLPSGWTYTSGAGSLINDNQGFTPGTANNNAGCVQSQSGWLGSQVATSLTIYTRVAKPAICVDQSQSSTTAWYESVGNPYGAGGGSYPPCLWQIQNSAGTRVVGLLVGAGSFAIQDYDSGTYANLYQDVLLNPVDPDYQSPNTDPNYWDVTVSVNGAVWSMWVDGVFLGTVTNTNGALPTGILYKASVGNSWGGTSAYFGGSLGPYVIRRFQIASALTALPILPILVGMVGDSYTAGGGVNGGSVAVNGTISALNNDQLMNSVIAQEAGSQNVNGQFAWCYQVESYAYKQLGGMLPLYGAAKTGYSLFFSGGYSDPIVNYTSYTMYWDALNAAQPQIVVCWGTVNDQLTSPSTTGAGVTPVADMKKHFDYWAQYNPQLRVIIFVEEESLQWMPSNTGSLTPAQCQWLSARWRGELRSAFYTPNLYLANGSVPVVYVPTYENMAGADDGILLHWGSNPHNTITTGGQQGPKGASPDVHQTPVGRIKIADLIWPILRHYILAYLYQPSGLTYNGGSSANAATPGTIIPNCAQGITQTWTMAENITVGIPINPPNVGEQLQLTFVENGTGSYTITFNATYRDAPSWSAGTAGQRATALFRYDGVNWQYVGGSSAFA